MFDCILPIGQSCNITFLMENADLKRQTTLFEWFISPTLNDITNVLIKISNNTDTDIITQTNDYIFIGDKIRSDHYNYENFLSIYKRRRDRLVDKILSSKKILFCRFEADSISYTKEDIDNFINTVLTINKTLEDIKLLIITPHIDLEHPSLIKVIYNEHHADPYCNNKKINRLFVSTLQTIGYIRKRFVWNK